MKMSDLYEDYYQVDDIVIKRVGHTKSYLLAERVDGENMIRYVFEWEVKIFDRHRSNSRFDTFIRKILYRLIKHNRLFKWQTVRYIDGRFPEERIRRMWPEEYERALEKQKEKQEKFDQYMEKQREIREYRRKNNIPW